jgi:hypothetical protein
VLGDLILHFFEFFLLFFTVSRIFFFYGSESYKSIDFLPILKKVKKIEKNVKFGLQARFNMDIILNGSDRLFGL